MDKQTRDIIWKEWTKFLHLEPEEAMPHYAKLREKFDVNNDDLAEILIKKRKQQ